MNVELQKLCVWSGAAAMGVFFVGLLTTGFFPPPNPALDAEAVALIYQTRTTEIRIGGLLIMISAMFAAPFYGALSIQLRRLEGSKRPVMAYAQLATGAANVQFFVLPGLLLLLASLRPDRPIEVTYALNDLVWVIALLPWPIGAMQALITGLAILKHDSSGVPFPRWLGYFNLWIAVAMVTPSLIPFFKTGPFAWNGLFGFWIPAVVFGSWMIMMLVMLLRAVGTETRALSGDPT